MDLTGREPNVTRVSPSGRRAEPPPRQPRRLFFLIRSLEGGGAERQLVELVRRLDPRRFRISVATFYDGGVFRSEMQAIEGVRLHSLHKRGRWDIIGFTFRLLRLVRSESAEIIYGQMWDANLMALLVGKLTRRKVVWSLRSGYTDFSQYDRLLKWLFDLAVLLSRFADLVIANSVAGRAYHVDEGYRARRFLVIPNGIDTDRYQFDEQARQRLRLKWSIAPEQRVIGMMARVDPMKRHTLFLDAAARLAAAHDDLRFVCVGRGAPEEVARLRAYSRALGLEGRVIWAGFHSDVAACYSAFDLLISSSSDGEGFSNVIAEAMATGLECVVTDIGDSAVIVGETGRVVAPNDVAALAAACEAQLSARSGRSAAARERIVREFGAQKLGDVTAAALEAL